MKTLKNSIVLSAAMCLGAQAAIVYETDYTLRSDNGNPFADGGELRFQDSWLGQTGYIVDSDAPGTVTASGAFLRTLNGNGATGGTAGGDGSGEVGTDFSNGDIISVTVDLQYNLLTSPNQALSAVGFREDFVNGGFNASPTVGLKVAYNSFSDGSLKVYSNLSRAGFNGADNAFAVFVTGPEGGFNSGGNGGTQDFVTDNLRFQYTAEFLNDAWVATELLVTNLDTATVVAQASVENPNALESTAYTGTEAFFGQRLTDTGGVAVTSDSMKFEYTPVPEPGTALLALLPLATVLRRRR
ncbi:MAG: hypothetical protein AAGI48_17885 [Verrucomicrobiota bacterium]